MWNMRTKSKLGESVKTRGLVIHLSYNYHTCQESLSVHIWHKSLWLHPYRATSHRLLLFSSFSLDGPTLLNHTNELDFTYSCTVTIYKYTHKHTLCVLYIFRKNVLQQMFLFLKLYCGFISRSCSSIETSVKLLKHCAFIMFKIIKKIMCWFSVCFFCLFLASNQIALNFWVLK